MGEEIIEREAMKPFLDKLKSLQPNIKPNIQPSLLGITHFEEENRKTNFLNFPYEKIETEFFDYYYSPHATLTSAIVPKVQNIKIDIDAGKSKIIVSSQDGQKLAEYNINIKPQEQVLMETGAKTTIALATISAIPSAFIITPSIGAVATKAIASGAISTLIGSGIRYGISRISGQTHEQALSEAIKKENIIGDFALGAVSYGAYHILSKLPYTTLSPWKYVKTFASTSAGVLGRDIAVDIAKGEPIKLAEEKGFLGLPGWTDYIIIPTLSTAFHYTGEKIAELHYRGKLPLPKIGYAKRNDEEVLALTLEKGAESKPIIGIKFSKQGIAIGGHKQLQFSTFSPEEGIPKSPLEYALVKEQMFKYYSDKTKGFTPEQLEIAHKITREIYRKFSEKPSISLEEVLKSSKRLTEKEAEILKDILLPELKKGSIELYGSGSVKTYGKEILKREIHDLDLQEKIPGSVDRIINKIKNLFKNWKIVELDGNRGFQVYNEKGEKVLEIFREGAYGFYDYNKYLGYGFRPLQPKQTKEGLVMSLEETTARKFVSSFTPQEEGLMPLEKRMKDIPDMVNLFEYYSQKSRELNKLVKTFISEIDKSLKKTDITFKISSPSSYPHHSLPISIPSFHLESKSIETKKDYSLSSKNIYDYSKSLDISKPSDASKSISTSHIGYSIPSPSYYLPPPKEDSGSVSNKKDKSYSYSIPSYYYSYDYSQYPPSSTPSYPSYNVPTYVATPILPFFLPPSLSLGFREESRKIYIPTKWVSEFQFV